MGEVATHGAKRPHAKEVIFGSFSLLLIPDANTDVFVFYFTIILLASISDRLMLSLLAPIVTSGAYLAFLLARYGVHEVLQPAILLRLPETAHDRDHRT